MMTQPLTASPSARLSGRIRVPGDKSISHRALILGALATGTTRISGLLEAVDIEATANAIAALGAEVERSNGTVAVKGQGVGGLRPPVSVLDFGNSGTASRLMLGVIAGHDMQVELTGDASLQRRPMGRVLTPLAAMGLQTDADPDCATLPLMVRGTSDLLPIIYDLPVPSAQVKSAILLAGLHAPGRTTVIEPMAARDHTERMLGFFGAELVAEDRGGSARAVTVCGDAELHGASIAVPGDPSSAAFVIAAALIAPRSDIVVEGVLLNPTRSGFIETLLEMGANIEIVDRCDQGGEPAGDLRVRSSALKGIRVPPERAPAMIDEYPILACVAAFAEGETAMEGLAELKVKESDRLAATQAGLTACGVSARIEGDALFVEGKGEVKGGACVETLMDHRIAMAFLTLGLGARLPVSIDDASMIATSFPNFLQIMTMLGANIS
jgi:3-phosphoshikimate 1-carboxyvinyltransferase